MWPSAQGCIQGIASGNNTAGPWLGLICSLFTCTPLAAGLGPGWPPCPLMIGKARRPGSSDSGSQWLKGSEGTTSSSPRIPCVHLAKTSLGDKAWGARD